MKIVHIIDYFQPQLGYQETNLAKEHAKMGHDVTVITSDRYFPFKNYNRMYKSILGERIIGESEQEYNNYKIIRIKPKLELASFVVIPQVTEKLIHMDPDIVIHHNVLKPNIIYTLNALRESTFKLIVDSHAAEYNSNFNSPLKKLYLFWFNRIISPKLDKAKILSTGINEQKFLNKLTGLSSEIIALGADIQLFKPDKDIRKSARAELGYSEKDVVVVHAGKLNHDKKTDWVIDTFMNLKFQITNLKLLLIGNNQLDLPSTHDLTHIGFVQNKDLNRYFNAADVGIWPGSRSNVVIEAMASGLPIIIEDMEYSRDLVNNDNGFAISTKDELETALKKLITDKNLRHKAGNNSRIHAVNNYNWEILSKKFLK